MDRALPCGNKICAKRMEARRLELHRARVRNVRPLVDTSEPAVTQLDHVRNNLKKEQLLEERYSEIDRENRILLRKMSDIMKHQNLQLPSVCQPGPQSLNRDARKKELLRITRDNQSILKRIQQAQPVYNHIEWEGTHRRNLSYLKNCAEFPLVMRSARGRPSELVPVAGSGAGQDKQPMSARSTRGATSHEDSTDPRATTGVQYVLKEGKTIGNTYYLIEMVTDGQALSIVAYDGEAKSTLQLVLKETAYRKIYRETHGDHSLLVQRLAIKGGQLVLVEPIQESKSSDEMDVEAMVAAKTKTGPRSSAEREPQ